MLQYTIAARYDAIAKTLLARNPCISTKYFGTTVYQALAYQHGKKDISLVCRTVAHSVRIQERYGDLRQIIVRCIATRYRRTISFRRAQLMRTSSRNSTSSWLVHLILRSRRECGNFTSPYHPSILNNRLLHTFARQSFIQMSIHGREAFAWRR